MTGTKNIKNNVYYLIQDLLSCFPYKFERNFISAINHHYIAKKATRQILIDEIKLKKPRFNILIGALILQNSFLRQMQRTALYEVIDIIEAIKFCFKKSRFITVKKLSAQIILRLFCILYFEYIILPGKHDEGKEFISGFKKHFPRDEVIRSIEINNWLTYAILKEHGFDIYMNDEGEKELISMLNKFYSSRL